ncbi:hypothetical protein GQR58_028853 [Nymphon striatum]|nr:hypothetical protein GQR58_028853 [Nymphon striatum]
MAFIQRFNTLGSSTFGQLQERYREKLLNMKPRHCTEVHFVGDQYDFGLKSLKGDERQKLESNINLPEYVPADSMKIPDWKTLLSNPCNRTNMLSYLASRWSQEASWPADFCLVLGVNAQATRVTQTEHTDVDELYCPNHEEADTRIFAHIASCDDNNVFVIQATDTDIIVLAMYHFPRLPNVVELWVEKNDLFSSIHDLVTELAKAVGKDVLALTDTLLISYILSSCDSVSYPFKRDQVITEARSFLCDLYGKPGYLSLDKLSAHLLASSKLDLRSLPPTEDAFHFHVLRSLCQISLYKQASLSNPVLLPPEEYGRIVDGDRLIPVMKSKPSKPSAAKLKYCKCKKKPNCLRNCPCAKAAVPCIIACACNGDREKGGRLLTDNYDDDDDDDDFCLPVPPTVPVRRVPDAEYEIYNLTVSLSMAMPMGMAIIGASEFPDHSLYCIWEIHAETAPEVHEEFAAGKFTVHLTAGDFNGVWTDLALEQTYNREGKTSLFKGIKQLESAREKYIKALPFMTSVSESAKQMAHMTSSQSDHREKLRKDDMEAVLQIKRTVEEKMQNPFHPSLATDKLMNISTGQILAATTLVDAKRLGLKAMDAATTTNADKIVQPKMETFATHLKKIQKKIDTVKEVIKEESAVTRALCFAQNLSDEARTEAFSYEWLEYPPSLFEPEKNGYSMRKGCKSTYLSTLQAEVADSWEPLKELPPSSADAVYVVDAMAFIQRFNTLGSSTFGQLQERYREKLLNMKPRHCTEVHFVGDQYDFGLKSLKGDERQRRESNINLPEYVPADSMKIPDWKTLLSNPCNKTNMLSYLASRWSQEASWPAGFCLVLGVNAQATRVT